MTNDLEARLRALVMEWWGQDGDGRCAHRKPEEEQQLLDTLWGEHPTEWLMLFAREVAALAAQEQEIECQRLTIERDKETEVRRAAEAHVRELQEALSVKPYPDEYDNLERQLKECQERSAIATQEQRVPEDGEKVTRLEVINENGRAFYARPVSIKLSYQDDGRTLKIFAIRATAPEQEKPK